MAKSKLDSACITAIKTCMGTKKDERVLVITDEQKRKSAAHSIQMH